MRDATPARTGVGRWFAMRDVASVRSYAMTNICTLGINREPITVDDIRDLDRLLTMTVPGLQEGEFRTVQN